MFFYVSLVTALSKYGGWICVLGKFAIKLGHTIAQRCAGSKSNASAAGDLIQVLAFIEHVRGLFRFRGGILICKTALNIRGRRLNNK